SSWILGKPRRSLESTMMNTEETCLVCPDFDLTEWNKAGLSNLKKDSFRSDVWFSKNNSLKQRVSSPKGITM
ncbi:MAG: hypothetical protein ABI761_18090, partial [Saprospiraceae bacterium]